MNLQFNLVDVLILFGILVFTLDGIRAGLIAGILELVGFLASLTLALLFFSKLEAVINKLFLLPESITPALAFLLIWILTETVYYLAARKLFSKIPEAFLANIVTKILGILPAAANGLLLFAFLLTLFTALPIPTNFKSEIFASKIGGFLVLRTTKFEKPLTNIFAPAVSEVEKNLTFLTVVPESKKTVYLNFTQTNLKVDPASEEKMLELVNSERTSRGLKTLIFDESLRDVARAHSRDMFQRGYFSHYSPEGADVGDRLNNAGIPYSVAGENLAYAPNVLRAHQGLMDSQGHRENILNSQFARVGIGVIDGGLYGKMFTQVFTN